MRTVNEVSKFTGVSVRTLHHYDAIGLLKPTAVSEAGYRLYDDTALERLQQILLFRELKFPLREIKAILESPNFDRGKALEQQIGLLTMKKEHLENLILFARGIKAIGVNQMDFTAFDTSKMDEYAAEAKARWGQTAEYREYADKSKDRTNTDMQKLNIQLMTVFTEFSTMRALPPEAEEVQTQVRKLQRFITENFYTCTNEILYSLGKMYAGGGDFTENIDKMCGKGTAEFVFHAVSEYCHK